MILSGIDVGAGDNSAIAIYDPRTKQYLNMFSGTVFEVLDELYMWTEKQRGNICVAVEDNTLEKAVFNQFENFWPKLEQYFYKRIGSKRELEREFGRILGTAQNVGKNKYLCKIFVQELEKRHIPHVRISPSDRDRADKLKNRFGLTVSGNDPKFLKMPTKLSDKQFELLTGYSYPTNEHIRDAATLVWDKTVVNLFYLAKKRFGIEKFIKP